MAGLTPEGFETKRLPQVIQDLRRQAIPIFQDLLEDPNDFVDTSEDSTIGRFIGLLSPALTDLWEASQDVYSAFDPNSATGISLDNLVELAGISRLPASPSVAQVLMFGDIGTVVEAGNVVEDPVEGNRFNTTMLTDFRIAEASGVGVSVAEVVVGSVYTISRIDIGGTREVNYEAEEGDSELGVLQGLLDAIVIQYPQSSAYIQQGILYIVGEDIYHKGGWAVTPNLVVDKVIVTSEVLAQEVGPIAQEPNSISRISTPVLGWDSVTNPLPATIGRDTETDEELRLRFRDSKHLRASNLLESMYAAILDIGGVSEVRIYENDTSEVNDIGLPPHSFMPIVVGGGSESIANAVWNNKPIGIGSEGNVSVEIRDAAGFLQEVRFSRPIPVEIHIRIEIVKDSQFSQSGEDLIRAELVNYFRENFGIGRDVIYSRLMTPINRVQGFYVTALDVGIGEANTKTNVPINFDEIASLSFDNIEIVEEGDG